MSSPSRSTSPASTPPASAPSPSSPALRRLLPWIVAVAFLMESLDTTILNTAAPTMAEALEVAPLSMKAVLSSYTLSLAVFIPISGWMADRFGTRQVFSWAIAIFTLGSLLCGIATHIHVLVACRILQGMGGALMVPVGRLTIVRTFDRSELVRAMSFVAIPALVGPMLGPVVGGFIVHYFHWRAIFFVNLPVGLLGLYLVWRHLPDFRAEHVERLDWVGLLLFGSGTALLSYVLEVFGDHTLPNEAIAVLLCLALALLAAYFHHGRRIPHPLLQLDLFSIRTFRTAVGGSFITRLGAGGLPFLLPLLYQVGIGYSPVQSGLLLMPQAIAALGLKMSISQLLTRFGYRKLLLWNTVLMGGAIASFSLIGPNTPVFVVVMLAACFGFLASLQYTSMNTLAYADVPNERSSMGSTLASTLQQMSLSFGVATASLAAAIFIPQGEHASSDQLIHGIHWALRALGVCTMLSALVFRQLRPSDGANVSRSELRDAEVDDGASRSSMPPARASVAPRAWR